MGSPFQRKGRAVHVLLGAAERAVLAGLLADVHSMLEGDRTGTPGGGDAAPSRPRDPLADLVGVDDDWLAAVESGATGPEQPLDERPAAERFDDPAVARLLPDANRDDPKMAAEFRRLTEAGLRGRKRATLEQARAALDRSDPVVLDAAEAQALLKGLTDVRLVLADRLGLRTDDDVELVNAMLPGLSASDEPWVLTALLYDELSRWQESLVRALPR